MSSLSLSEGQSILVLNGGSSSLKFALFDGNRGRRLSGKIERIGLANTVFSYQSSQAKNDTNLQREISSQNAAATFLLDWLEEQVGLASLTAIGHRVVHGMDLREPQRVSPELLRTLHEISCIDPEHLPGEIELIEAILRRAPSIPQIVFFDTAFHQSMPRVARMLPLPRRFEGKGIKRYGFHGISYAYLLSELSRLAGAKVASGKLIFAHLGSGASLCALNEGRSVDTTMGYSPCGGLPMGTRSGDLDPGVVCQIMETEQLNPAALSELVNHHSGLLGISETSSDMRDLLKVEATDIRASEAIALFCYEIKKTIGSLAAALGGVETLVFSGGIGEKCSEIRSRICQGLEFLGIEIDSERNNIHSQKISTERSRVRVHVIQTDEEQMIAEMLCQALAYPEERA